MRFNMSSWPVVHMDDRRLIRETEIPEFGISLQGFEIFQPIALGNHYHAKKAEIFFLLEGAGVFTCQQLRNVPGEYTVPAGPMFDHTLAIGQPFCMPLLMAHAVVLEPVSKMVCLSTEPFDKDDLIPWILIR